MRRLFLALSLFAISLPATAQSPKPKSWFFAVLADPQLGMYAKDKNFAQETANFEFAIANLNRLHPRFVVICGDFVNRTGDPSEIAEFKRVLQKLDPSIPVYNVAGNHDVGGRFADFIGQREPMPRRFGPGLARRLPAVSYLSNRASLH